MAENTQSQVDVGRTPSASKVDNVGVPNPQPLRALAEDLPERGPVEKAIKEGMLADTAQQEARAKAKVVEHCPDSQDTPSGYALQKVAGIANDTERGEQYLRHKTARRWGYVPADES